MERKIKAIIIPKGYYVYLKKLFLQTMKDSRGKEFDGEITDTEIASVIGGLILEHEGRGGKTIEEVQEQLWKWSV